MAAIMSDERADQIIDQPQSWTLRPIILFTVAAMLIYWTDVLRLVFPGEVGTASAAFRLTHFAIYGVVALLLAREWARCRQLIVEAPLLVLLLLLPLVSMLWSIDPQETLQRSIAVIGSSLFGIYLATQFSQLQTLRLLAVAAMLAALLSLVLIVAVPSIGITQTEEYYGTWKGAYSHKNGFGQMTALGAVVCALLIGRVDGVTRQIAIVGFCLNLLLLAGSRSLTAQMLFAFSILTMFFAGTIIRFAAKNQGVALLVATALSLLLWVAFSVDDATGMLATFGKDANLSARWPMWQSLLPFIEQKFWLGFGYEAFWTNNNYAVAIITKQLNFRPHYGHNGIIELLLGLGALGTLLFFAVFVNFVRQAVVLLRDNPDRPLYLLGVVFALAMGIHNTFESTILQRNAMTWNLFVMLAAYHAMAARGAAIHVDDQNTHDRFDASAAPSVPQRLLVV
jgi:exopolysaccharide production protein ExoQ